MTISRSDIKLLASQQLTDNANGGGLMTGTEIVDGNVNNLFPDISRFDRTIGRVSLRKAFPAILTQNTDTYYGAHAILTDPPDDDNVTTTIFSTKSFTDVRSDAKNAIESYVIRGVLTRMRLYDTQIAGQSTLLVMQLPSLPLPELGEVYMLVEDDGLQTQYEQFVRVNSVDHQVQSFADNSGAYDLRIITIGLSDPLRETFHGGAPSRYDTSAQGSDNAVVRSTSVADTSRYYGVSSLAQDINANDLTFRVDSIYNHLVPSSTSETPLADTQAGGESNRLIDSAVVDINVTIGGINSNTTYYVGSGIKPKSFVISYAGEEWQDQGDGTFTKTQGSSFIVDWEVVDYAEGVIKVTNSNVGGGNFIATFTPATSVSGISDTDKIDISIQNRGLNYVKTLIPSPAPQSLVVEFMSLGKWYTLRDQGDGTLKADQDNTGVGSVNYATGTVILTLASIPDVDSSILFTWGGANHYEIRTGDVEIDNPVIEHTVVNGSIVPSSLTISWLSNGATKTATDNGNGALIGDANGGVIYTSGHVGLLPINGAFPDPNSAITYDYDYGIVITDTFNPTKDGNNFIDITLASPPVKAGSVEVDWTTSFTKTTIRNESELEYWGFAPTNTTVHSLNTSTGIVSKKAKDNGLGVFLGNTGATINYASGLIHLQSQNDYATSEYNGNRGVKSWDNSTTTSDTFANGSLVSVRYMEDTVTPTTAQDVTTTPSMTLNLLPSVTDMLIPGSIRFTWAGKTYIDRAGNIYRDVDVLSNAATLAGSVDYSAGIVTLTNWAYGTGDITILSLLSQFGEWTNYEAMFRTAGSPLQPLSFYISANRASDGVLVNDSADANGVISTTDISGKINIENGLASVKFGRYVVAAGNESEPWYDVEELDGNGNIWQPEPMIPSTIKYNAVVLASIPIDAALIGIDSVRLPSDGRVPIYRAGGVVVLHQSDSETMPNGLTANQTISLSGTGFNFVELYDQDGTRVPSTEYSTDLSTSVVTMSATLDLSGFIQPLIAYKRIEEMKLMSDVQINGQITVTSKFNNNYTVAANAMASSALPFGDLASRYFNVINQQTWTGEWSDNLIGNGTTSKLNHLQYPIQVTNIGAIEERWILKFTSATTFDIVGETIGQIGTGATNGATGTFIQPLNPATNEPYFKIPTEAFGAGWSTGNVIRFNTESANAPVWFARTTLPGDETEPTDQFTFQIRGDAN